MEETLVKGRVVERLTYKDPATRKFIHHYSDIPSQRKQMRVALRHCGLINPESIDEYIAVGGYEALSKAFSIKPEAIIEEVKTSGLRGRGGAGFPTGRKWESAHKARGDKKYILANGDEGDPNCFMDRALMEGDPFAILEGMTIGAGVPWVEPTGSSTCPTNTRRRSRRSRTLSSRRASMDCSARISWDRALILTSSFAWALARL